MEGRVREAKVQIKMKKKGLGVRVIKGKGVSLIMTNLISLCRPRKGRIERKVTHSISRLRFLIQEWELISLNKNLVEILLITK